MGRKFKDNALTTLASSITGLSTTLTVAAGKGDNFPAVTGAGTPGSALDYFVITLEDASGNREKIKVEQRAAGVDALGTVGYPLVRGYDGTAARAWAAGDSVDLRLERAGVQEAEDRTAQGNGHAFGNKPATTSALTYGYYGGVVVSGGAFTTIADGTVAMTSSSTNYVERTLVGAVSANTSGFTASRIPMAVVVTDASKITSISDRRPPGAQVVSALAEDTSPDKIADFLGSYDASAGSEKKLRIITALARAMPFGQGLLINGKVSTSVGSNALTVAVKGDDGNDPSSTNPVYALFRKSTLTDSGFDVVEITGALSVVVSSGSTLGHVSAIAQHIFVYLINNAGAAELAVSNLPPDYPGVFGKARLVSTTAEGGAGAADSASGVYSTTARSNVPWVCVAKMLSTQATAGTWASAMTQVDAAPFALNNCAFKAYRSSAQTLTNAVFTKIQFDTEQFDTDGCFDNATNYRFQPNVAGVYQLEAHYAITVNDTNQVICEMYLNGGGGSLDRDDVMAGGANQVSCKMGCVYPLNGTTDYVEVYAYQATGGNANLSGAQQLTNFSATRVPGGSL